MEQIKQIIITVLLQAPAILAKPLQKYQPNAHVTNNRCF